MRRPNLCHLVATFALLPLLAGAVAPASAQVNATLKTNEARLQGTHPGGSLLLYSPDPVAGGSSLSHWAPEATPNLLMEPFLTADLPVLGLDVTPGQMQDVFWAPGSLNINIFNLDAPGVGFTDPTPFAGAPGNPATTLGEARVNLFNAVLGAWANTLGSSVDVDVLVTWQPQFCSPSQGAVLASAGPTFIIALEGGGLPGPTFFHAAIAESLLATDLTGPPADGGGDIIVFVNGDIDKECLAPGTGFYYGLDGNAPANLLRLDSTVIHELGHGLGFSNFVNETTGAQSGGLPGIYDLWTFDNTSGKFWDQMTDAERAVSAVNFQEVTWEGPSANIAAATTMDPGVPELDINSPPSIAGTYPIGTANFGPPLPGSGGISADTVCMIDTARDLSDLNGCAPANNAGALTGKIALINRGECSFTDKVANAQAAGAIGAIISNNAGDTPFPMGGSDPTITIPSVMVGQSDGNKIRQETCPCPDTVTVTNRNISGSLTFRAATDAQLGPSLTTGGSSQVRVFVGTQAQLENDVAIGGDFTIGTPGIDACITP